MNENLTKIREWVDGVDNDEWPAPPEYTEYEVGGQMRIDILERVGRDPEDSARVRLIEGIIEGGYSEYTAEHDYPIEVWIDNPGQSQRVFDHETYSQDSSMAALLRWLGA